jgi:hypothetical protein
MAVAIGYCDAHVRRGARLVVRSDSKGILVGAPVDQVRRPDYRETGDAPAAVAFFVDRRHGRLLERGFAVAALAMAATIIGVNSQSRPPIA